MENSKLRDARGDRSQKEIADMLGISVSALSMYESGERSPRDDLKVKMAQFYNTTVGALFFGEKVHET